MTFPSVYEMFTPIGTIPKQHFWEWFSGDSLNSRWTNHGSSSPTYVMNDAVDGGLRLTSSGVGNAILGFNNRTQFDVGQCTFIAIFRRNSSNQYATAGIRNSPPSSGNAVYMLMDTGASNIQLLNNGGSPTTTVTTTPIHTNWTTVKIENDRANTTIKLSLDGVLAGNGTSTTNISSSAGQPVIATLPSSGSATTTCDVRYIEAYNT